MQQKFELTYSQLLNSEAPGQVSKSSKPYSSVHAINPYDIIHHHIKEILKIFYE